VWGRHFNSYKFDVVWASELRIYLSLKNPDAPEGSQDISLGMAGVNPVLENEKPLVEWLAVKNGTGKYHCPT
jgi:hypothetical protein